MTIRFLVVDDATFIRDMVKKQLRDHIPGVEVFDATDGNRAIAQLKKQRVDVILSDWEMPGMSGEEFLRWVRAHEDYKDTPFIMVTSRGDREFVVKAIQTGVSDFITKPFSAEELLRKTLKQLKKVGKSPLDALNRVTAASTQGVAFASVDALTGGRSGDNKPEAPSRPAAPKQTSDSAALLMGKSAAAPTSTATKKSPSKKAAKTKAQLRFPNTTCGCVVRDMSLQGMSGLMQRCDPLPGLFELAVVDIETEDGDVARVNGYLSSIAAGENKLETNIIKISIRFVDNDVDKFEALSKFIAKIR